MKVNRLELLTALKKISGGLEQADNCTSGFDCFLFQANSIFTYNDFIFASALFPIELTGSVRSKAFLKLLEKIKTDEIDIEEKKGHWQIKAGKMKAKINLQSNSDHLKGQIEPLLSEKEWNPLPDNFYEGLKACKLNSSFSKRGIYVDRNLMMSTDVIRLNYFEMDKNMHPFWLDDLAVNELVKVSDKMTQYCVVDSWVYFWSQEGTIWACKRNDDAEYPFDKMLDYKKQLAQTDDNLSGVFPDDSKEVIERVGILSNNVYGYNSIKLDFFDGVVRVESNCSAGSIDEIINCGFSGENNIKLLVDVGYLLEIISKCVNFYVVKKDNMCVMVFEKDNYTQILQTIKE